jgi:hypothetical protein
VPQLPTSISYSSQRPNFSRFLTNSVIHQRTNSIQLSRVESSLMLRLTVNRPLCLQRKHPSGANDQIFITVRQLRVCRHWALSLTRGRICRLQFLLALAIAVILRSETRGIHDHISLSQIRGSPNLEDQVLVFIFLRNRVVLCIGSVMLGRYKYIELSC